MREHWLRPEGPCGRSRARGAGNTPGFIKKATDNGAADPTQVIDVQVWLKLRNESKLDTLVQAQRTKGSASYHRRLSQGDFNATYAPTAQEVTAVTNFLNAHGITVGDIAENNFYVNASGPISAIEKAFHVQIDSYTYDGAAYYSNAADPTINDSSGAQVAAITGLDDFGAQPTVASQIDASTYKPLTSTRNGLAFPAHCFNANWIGTATFSTGLPPVDLTIARAPGVWHNSSPHLGAAGWSGETTLDVEWAHAMAPGAKIVLVPGPTNTGSLDEAINYAVVHHLGNVISNSWSNFEGLANPAKFDRDQRILEQAAAEGIDVNFSSGDWGDNTPLFGIKAPSFPADSPYATSVGGTSLALNADNTIAWQTGWGTSLTRLATKTAPVDPSAASSRLGYQYGSGGGFSLNYAKPSWQTGTPGTTRAFPDISMVGDPYTGVEIIQTVGGRLSLGTIGGTSLSCPLFSGLMAIATQKAGHGLGQVAPLLYQPSVQGAISDVTQKDGSPWNPTGTYNGTTFAADELANVPGYGLPPTYFAALYHSPYSGSWFDIDFGVDTSLLTGAGWDDVTGLGSPNDATAFVNAVAAAGA